MSIHPNQNDVLSGRGKFTMLWSGNTLFRQIVEKHKADYAKVDNFGKELIAKNIVHTIRKLRPPGRFLKLDSKTNQWFEIETKLAVRKTRQALREGNTNSASKDSNSVSATKSLDSANNGAFIKSEKNSKEHNSLQPDTKSSSQQNLTAINEFSKSGELMLNDNNEPMEEAMDTTNMNQAPIESKSEAMVTDPLSFIDQSNAMESVFLQCKSIHDLLYVEENKK